MALGGDQGGSIRYPSCWSGCVGLKPTYGLVPATGSIGKQRFTRTLRQGQCICQGIATFCFVTKINKIIKHVYG